MNTQEQQLTQYRRLEMGEIVLATDEIYDDNTREWVEPEWSVGKPAPDPDCTSHRQFRRKINSLPNTPEQQLSESLLAACKAAGIEKPKFIAQNANGKVIHHDNQPSRKGWDSIWGGGGIPKRLNHPPYADHWQDSLMEWVDHVADTSKKIDDACKVAYHAHIQNGNGLCWSRLDCYRAAWQDALAWKGGSDD